LQYQLVAQQCAEADLASGFESSLISISSPNQVKWYWVNHPAKSAKRLSAERWALKDNSGKITEKGEK